MIPATRRHGREMKIGPLVLPVLLAALGLTGCGDPVVILGDQPGIMRPVLGVPADQTPDDVTPATREQLNTPKGLAVDEDGVLYVADHRARRILAVFSNGELETVVDHRTCSGDACMNRPDGVALDGSGGLVVTDPLGGRVWRVSLASGTVSLVAGRPGGGPATPGAAADQVELASPVGVAVTDDGRVLFSEQDAHRVWAVGREGTLEPVAGTGVRGQGGDGGDATQAGLFVPAGLFIAQGRLYIADRGNHKIRAVDLETGVIQTVAGTGSPGFAGDGGPATQAALRSPVAAAITPDGVTMFIADTGNNRIRAVNLTTGVIRTFAGTGDAEFTGSGLEAGDTSLDAPEGLAVLGGLLFIADPGHQLVWRTPVRF